MTFQLNIQQSTRESQERIGICVNGIQIYKTKSGEHTIEISLNEILLWLIKNFREYCSEEMPKQVIPAIRLHKEIETNTEEYWVKHRINDSSPYAARFAYVPRTSKKRFFNWLASHTIGYPNLNGKPVVLQRRRDIMEVSWDFPKPELYENPEGKEEVDFKDFEKEIIQTISKNAFQGRIDRSELIEILT